MFDKKIYIERRKQLKDQLKTGIALFPGNDESPMNYSGNTYHFRQDSSFLYYFGVDVPGFAAMIDVDQDSDILFGDDFSVDDIVWMGPQPTVASYAEKVGASDNEAMGKLDERIKNAIKGGRRVHYLPQYRHDNIIKVSSLTGIDHSLVNAFSSEDLIRAVVTQRSMKSDEEIAEIEKALDITHDMYVLAMEKSRPGMYEREVAGEIEGLVLSRGSNISFPIIFSIHGETLHNHSHDNLMKDGDILVLDSGADSPLHYASDITRTFPVGKKYSSKQRDIYDIVLNSQLESINMMHPGVSYKDVHLKSAAVIAEGLKQIGLMKGNVTDAVSAGAHALFFPHGLGHMLGLDVHDMEGLGENYVGYHENLQRSEQFGLAYLRFAKQLEPGHVLTVEPGIYFIPELIDQWKSEKKLSEYIDYDKVGEYVGFGGIRIEDDVLITDKGSRVLGKPIPKEIRDIESLKE
ncbi:MAG: aminopeptidase P family protein [candidate division KSB1 bacterium]|jgi:Xaa-Pro aminopeptidase|nr:aminopeptidase P family protein [candidate division KSB1 bacterium]